jgi:hypothetical protein
MPFTNEDNLSHAAAVIAVIAAEVESQIETEGSASALARVLNTSLTQIARLREGADVKISTLAGLAAARDMPLHMLLRDIADKADVADRKRARRAR